jgi:hypothetical protein
MDFRLSQDMWTMDGVGLCMFDMYMTLFIVYSWSLDNVILYFVLDVCKDINFFQTRLQIGKGLYGEMW